MHVSTLQARNTCKLPHHNFPSFASGGGLTNQIFTFLALGFLFLISELLLELESVGGDQERPEKGHGRRTMWGGRPKGRVQLGITPLHLSPPVACEAQAKLLV